MGLWNYCAVCGERIETGQPCIGVKEESERLCGDSICLNCAKIENLPDGKETVPIIDLLARAEAAEARADRLAEELKAHSETDLAKAHEALSADWAKWRLRAKRAERCIAEIGDALTFGRYSAAMLRISEYRGQKEV